MSHSKIEKQFTTFVLRTVVGIRCDYYRREQRRRELESQHPTTSWQPSQLGGAVTLTDLLDTCDSKLCHQLGMLTEKQANVLLHLINGYTEREIALKMHITQQGVHSIKLRIRKKLEVERQ